MAESRKLPPAAFVAELPGSHETIQVELEPINERLFRARIDDRVVELNVQSVGPRSFLVANGDRVHEVAVLHRSESMLASLGASELVVKLIDRRRYRAGDAHHGAGGQSEIKAFMPGKVVTVLVKAGDGVEKDQPLLVLEAMKMENEVRSPRAGVVKELHVSAGQAVDTGELMVSLE